jgi:hypothetical protein
MQTNTPPIELLLASAVQYSKTSAELFKLKSVDITADVASTILSRAIFAIALSFFAIMLMIGVSFWLGDLLGKLYYGFVVTSLVSGAVALALFLGHSVIKRRVADSIIIKILR